jgi:acylphosphatase
MESYRFVVSGKVQGVYYRKFTAEKLRQMGIQGYVRNLPDGNVEVVVRIYEDEELEKVISVLREGSPLSETREIAREQLEDDDIVYDGFEIRY